MWGICLDAEFLSADLLQNLFQRVVEYEVDANDGKAVILAPQCGISTDLKNIKKLENPPLLSLRRKGCNPRRARIHGNDCNYAMAL